MNGFTVNDSQLGWCNQMPEKYRGSYRKAMDSRKPLAGIRAKCLDCMGWQEGKVKTCPVDYCPLWPYRMGRKQPLMRSGANSYPPV